MDLSIAIPALMLGLLGAGHCLGMCGGIVSALAMGRGHTATRFIIAYNLGRITSYALMGAVAAGITGLAPTGSFPLARTVAGLILILMGLYVAQWWNIITLLERVGGRFWALVKPLAGKFIPIKTVFGAYCVGTVWGWLPCGLVYSALAYGAAQGNAFTGAATMALFGVGTLPALVFGGVALAQVRRVLTLGWVRYALGAAYIAFGLWTIIIAWVHAGHHDHNSSHNHSQDHSMHEAHQAAPESSHNRHQHH